MDSIEQRARDYSEKLNGSSGEDFEATVEDYSAGANELLTSLKSKLKELKNNSTNVDKLSAFNSVSFILKELE
jgi:hypothetical protein